MIRPARRAELVWELVGLSLKQAPIDGYAALNPEGSAAWCWVSDPCGPGRTVAPGLNSGTYPMTGLVYICLVRPGRPDRFIAVNGDPGPLIEHDGEQFGFTPERTLGGWLVYRKL